MGEGQDLVLYYKCGVEVYVTKRFFLLYSIRMLFDTFLSVVPGGLVGLVEYCGTNSFLRSHRNS
jgi:hypothetical protein